MRKYLIPLLICIFLLGIASTSFGKPFRMHGRDFLTGGTRSVDNIPYATLTSADYSGHICIVVVALTSTEYMYLFDVTNTDAEDVPDTIKPDDAGANPGRWELLRMLSLATEDTSPDSTSKIYIVTFICRGLFL